MSAVDGRGYPRLYLKLEVELWRPSLKPHWARITNRGWAQTWITFALPIKLRFEYRTRNAQQAHDEFMASWRAQMNEYATHKWVPIGKTDAAA